MAELTRDIRISCAILIIACTNLTAETSRQALYPPSTDPNLTMHHPDVSPDGRHIALSAGANYLRSAIWIFDRQTGLGRQVTQPTNDMGWGDVCVRWSPDGQRVLFVSDRGGGTGVYLYDINSQSMEKIRDTRVSGAWWAQAVWDPTGTKILYPDSDSSGDENLYSIDLATRDIAQVTEHKGNSVAFPAWSASGRFIVYRITGDDGARLMRLDRERGVTEELHSGLRDYAFPRWNADESWLTFHSEGSRIFLLNTDSGTPIEVATPLGYQTWGPTWDGDSDVLLFQKRELTSGPVVIYDFERGSSWEIFEMSELSNSWRNWATWSRDSNQVSFFPGIRHSRADTALVIATVSTNTVMEIRGSERARQYLRAPVWSQLRDGYIYSAATELGDDVVFESWPDRTSELLFSSDRIITVLAMTADEEIIAYVAHAKGESNNQDIWFFDQISETHYQVTFRNSKIAMLSFSPDGEKLFFKSDENAFVLDTDTNTVHEVGEGFFWRGERHAWQENERLIFEGAKSAPPAALYEYDIAEHTTRRSYGNEARHCVNPFIKPNVKEDTYYQYIIADSSDLHRVNLATGISELVLKDARHAVFSGDGSKVIYLKGGSEKPASIWAADVSQFLGRGLP